MLTTKKIKVDILDKQNIPFVYAVQNDANTREIELNLFEGGVYWAVPDCVVSVAYTKRDGTGGWYDKLPDGSNACTKSGNKVTAILAPQVLTVDGIVNICIVMQDADTLDQISTFPLTVIVEPNPNASGAPSNDYYNYSTMEQVNDAIDSALEKIDTALFYNGKAVDQDGGFAGCTLPGYYTYSYHDIVNIPDAPEGLDSGGLVEVRPGAASGSVFQTIHAANGKEWFRDGAKPFKPVFRDKKQVDTLYTALGVINPGTIIQGAPTATGELNKWTTLSVCAKGPVFLGAGVTYSVLMEEGWVYTVMEFDDAQCSTKGTDYYNKSTSPTYTPKKDYGWFRFNKAGADGEYVDITPDDFNASVTFRRSEQSDDGTRSDVPESIGVLNAILNAKQCSQIRYTPIAALPTQKYEAGFPAGQEVQGLPYSSTRLEQLYVPNNVSFYTFVSALQNPKSLLYSVKLDEDYGVDSARTYYGIVCSILAEYALGIKPGYTTAMWDKIPGMELIADQSAYGLRLCDVIWRSGHCLLVTDIKRTGDGTIHSIEVTEATAGRDGTVDVINYTLAEFDAKFVHGDTVYKFYRYRHIGRVEHIPSAIVPVGGEVATEVTYNTNLMGRLGDRFNVRAGEDVVLDVLDQGAYTGYKVNKNGATLSTAAIPGDGVITLSGLAYGKYSVCLTGSGADSRAIEFIVVDAAAPTVTATGNTNEYKLDFFSVNATTPYIMWFVDNSRKAVVTQIDELTGNETSFTTVLQKTSGYVRVALETEYGIILSESAVGNFTGAPVEDEYPKDAERYYSSVSDAISDINSGIVSKAVVDGAVKVFTSDTGVLTVSLLDDVEEIASVTAEKSLNIALNGHTLRFVDADAVLQFAAGTDCTVYGGLGKIIKKNVASSDKIFLLRADGANLSIRETEIGLNGQAGTFVMAVRAAGGLVDMEDCHIESNNTADGGAWALQASAGEIVAKRCTLQVSNVGNKTGHQFNDAIGIVSGAKVTMEESSIIASSHKGFATGIKAFVGSSTDLIDTTISVVTNTDGSLSAAIGVLNHAGATLRVDGGKVLADAPGDSTPEDYAIGVKNEGVCHLKNANISGTHSGVTSNGKLYVDGGLYTGYSHGGFYFAHGADGVAYVNDATLRDGHYEGIFTDVFSGNTEGIGTLGGFYIGGGSGENNSNMAVYLDGCTFDVANRAFVLRGTDGEANNTVNISNSTVLDAANHPIRIDNETLRVNIGIGGNITPDMALTHEGEDASAWAQISNRLYRRKYDDPDYMALANAAVIAPSKATVGQTIRVKSVDDDGKPVEWECVDLASGGAESGWELVDDLTVKEAVKYVHWGNLHYRELKIYAYNPEGNGGDAYVAPRVNGIPLGSTADTFAFSGSFFNKNAVTAEITVFAFNDFAMLALNGNRVYSKEAIGEYGEISSFTWESFGSPEEDRAIRANGRYIVYGRK